MKQSTGILVKTAALILVFTLVMFTGVMMLSSAKTEDAEQIDLFSSPEINNAEVPIPRENLDVKFSKYNSETVEDGKSVMTVYSAETVDEFARKKQAGEWFYLTTEEMLYLIENTVELFESYDIVRIYDTEGVLHSYNGLSFYSSQEYLACFGGFDFGINDVSFDMKTDIYHTVFARASVLCSAVYDAYLNGTGGHATVMYTDIKNPPNASESNSISFGLNPWSKNRTDELGNPLPESTQKHYGVWIFDVPMIRFHSDSAEVSLGLEPSNFEELYPFKLHFDSLGQIKYDQDGKVIVAEIYESASREMIARVRFDSKNDPEIIQKAESLQELVFVQTQCTDTQFVKGEYYIVLYLNGFVSAQTYMHERYVYFADGDLRQFGVYEQGLFAQHTTVLADGSGFASYMNEIIKERLEQ